MAWIISLIFFVSGISGLIYQVVWVRNFGRVFGNTVYSASLVVGVFMCGLGIGSYLVGRSSDARKHKGKNWLLTAYGYCELAIAALGAIIALVVPLLEPLAGAISSYDIGADGWYQLSLLSYVYRYAIAVALLAPITIIMGGTLTLLIRFLLFDDVSQSGWRIGLLYGFNTAGAALGALLSDLVLIPNSGLLSTQMLAVVLNLAAAVAALRLAARLKTTAGQADDAPARPVAQTLADDRGPVPASATLLVGLAIFCSGIVGMGVEIIWFRHLGVLLGGYQTVFSLLLTVILVCMWLGALAAGWLCRVVGRPLLILAASQALLAVSVLALLAAVEMNLVERQFAGLLPAFRDSSGFGRTLILAWSNLHPILLLTGLPAFWMGFAYPLANAGLQRSQDSVGRVAGLLYLANTLGALLGSTLAGFVLLPNLGIQNSLSVLAAVALVAVAVLFVARSRLVLAIGEHGPGRTEIAVWFAASAGAIVVALVVWLALPPGWLLGRTANPGRRGEVLAVSEGGYELIHVLTREDGSRALLTNGHGMSGTGMWGQRYMRAFSHLPLLMTGQPTDVLVICFGVGSTLHAASLHDSVRRLEVVDTSRHVLNQAHHFAATNHDVLLDPRLKVFVNDGRLHLWMQPEQRYDLVTLEPPPISFAGVSSLYSAEFYELARGRLKQGGFFTQWLPGYQVPGDVVLSMVRAFVDVFPNAVLLSGAGKELILLGRRGGAVEMRPLLEQAVLAANPALAADLKQVHMGELLDRVAMYVAGAKTLRAATEQSPPVTDDFPIMDYGVGSHLYRNVMPAELFDSSTVGQWCPIGFDADPPLPFLAKLPAYLRVMTAYYASPNFRIHRNYTTGTPLPLALPADHEARAALRTSSFLSAFFGKANR